MLRSFEWFERYAVTMAHRMENASYLLVVQCAVQWMNADTFALAVRLGAVNERQLIKRE